MSNVENLKLREVEELNTEELKTMNVSAGSGKTCTTKCYEPPLFLNSDELNIRDCTGKCSNVDGVSVKCEENIQMIKTEVELLCPVPRPTTGSGSGSGSGCTCGSGCCSGSGK